MKAQYFVIISIKKEFCAKIEQNQYIPFRGSMMGRGLLWVQLLDNQGQKWTFMTSHLESTKGMANLSCGVKFKRLGGQVGTSDFTKDSHGHRGQVKKFRSARFRISS